MRSHLLHIAAFFAGIIVAPPIDDADRDDIPVIGRPVDLPFSGASGDFIVDGKAEPTTLAYDESLNFKMTIRATGAFQHGPHALNLAEIKEFADQFYVDPAPVTLTMPDNRTWVFTYRLKPRSSQVANVPAVPFVFFNPAIRPAERGFQIRYTLPIPIRITPSVAIEPALQPLSDEVYQLDSSP
ncbi:MAG: hypothetical protein ACRD36_12820, partial [Candidatus Acidiferrum sp.]